MMQGGRNLSYDSRRLPGRQPLLTDPPRQALPLHEVGDDVPPGADLLHVVDLHDVRVVAQRSDFPRVLKKCVELFLRKPSVRPRQFDRHVTFEQRIVGGPHLPEPALPELLAELIPV